jgi:hypothetical protein
MMVEKGVVRLVLWALVDTAVGGKCPWAYRGTGMCCGGGLRLGSESDGFLSE